MDTEKLLYRIWEECGYGDPSLDYCSPEMFILAYDPAVTLKKDMPSKWGKLSEAREAIGSEVPPENNQIYCAYLCQNEPNKLEAKIQANTSLETDKVAANQLEAGNEVFKIIIGGERENKYLTVRIVGR
jgi:hypothetical protein